MQNIADGRLTTQQGFARVQQLLDAQSGYLRAEIDNAVSRARSREQEVQGRFLISNVADERTGVQVQVERPRGMDNARDQLSRERINHADTTLVEWRVSPYDSIDGYDLDRWLSDGFRHTDRQFDWDNQDRLNDDPNPDMVEDDEDSALDADHMDL